MKYIKTLIVALTIALFATAASAATNAPAVSAPAADTGDWTLTLAGAGSTTTKGDSQSAIGLELGVGRTGTLLLPVEVGVRQKFSYASAGQVLNYGTKVYSDFTVLKVWQLEVQVGGNVSAVYGDTSLAYTAAPEAVVRLYLKKDVYAFGRVEYPYDITAGALRNSLDYTIGLGLKF